jgi:sulfoxide reductase heme-binding subunit YedZ
MHASVRRQAPYYAGFAAGLIPAAWTLHLGLSDQLGADPVKVLERSLGLWALRFLVVGLAITPMRVHGGPNLIGWRRPIGLLAFTYAALHLLVYVWLDQALDWSAILNDILKRPYITVGMLSFAILLPLALTSTNGMIRRLGAKAWGRLHSLVYLAAAAAALHFIMLVKSWPAEPLIYAGIVAVLLGWRVWDAQIGRAQRARARQARRVQPAHSHTHS